MEARSPSSSQYAMDMLLLTIPDQHEDSNPAVLLDEKLLRKWLSELPMMNVVQTVEMLQRAILPFNELKIESQLRLKLLECYREKIDEIFYSYDEMRLRQLPVSHEARQAIKTDIMWLYLELANGYKIGVKSALDRGANPKKDSGLLLAIYRAMEQIIHAMINAYRNAQTPPPLTYLETHQLYHAAAVYDAADKKVSGAKQEATTPSINHLYKQCMLLAVAEPEGMPEDSAFELYFLLEQFADTGLISGEIPADRDAYIYTLDFSDDARPVPLVRAGGDRQYGENNYLDVGPVIEKIKNRLDELGKENQGLMEKQEVRLLELYRTRIMSLHGRGASENESAEVYLSFGLMAAHYFMCGDNFSRYIAGSQESFGIEVHDVDEMGQMHELETWQIIEISNSGKMLLASESGSRQDMKIGMAVGVIEKFENDKPPVFTLGIIGWLPPEESDDRKIGIQIIPGRPEPVFLTETGAGALFSGLKIPEVGILNLSASLVVPAGNYAKDKLVTVEQGSTKIQVRLGQAINSADGVVHCFYSVEG